MLTRLWFVVIPLLAAWSAAAIQAQITSNPVPAPIVKRGLAVEIRDVVRLPDSRGTRPLDQDVSPAGWARINFVRDLPDGRRFANDSRGFLYLIGSDREPRVYANVAAVFPHAVYNRLESGFIGFVFHPEFARNGLFYTVHGERATGNPRTPDFIPPGFAPKDVTYHNVITEWHATNPAAAVVRGDPARTASRSARRREPVAPSGRGGVQPHREAGRSGLRTAVHQRQRSRLQQRRRTEREYREPDAAPRLHS